MAKPVRQSEPSAVTPEIEELRKDREDLSDRRAAIAALAVREQALREQDRDVSARELELSAAREELHQHERGLAGELTSLVAAELARAEDHERLVESAVAALAERAASLDERERELGAREAELETKSQALADEAEGRVAALAEIERRSSELAAHERKLGAQDAALESDRQALVATKAEAELEAQERDRALADQEATLAGRERELAARARTLDETARKQSSAAEDVARQRASFEERETKLEARAAEIEKTLANERRLFAEEQAALEARESELRDREQSVSEAASAQAEWAAERERQLETLREQERRLANREATVGRREKAVENVRVAVAESAERQSRASSLWNLKVLESLVSERGSEFPDQVEEWNAYLLSLGDVADEQGGLPRSLDPLLDGVFAPFADEASSGDRIASQLL